MTRSAVSQMEKKAVAGPKVVYSRRRFSPVTNNSTVAYYMNFCKGKNASDSNKCHSSILRWNAVTTNGVDRKREQKLRTNFERWKKTLISKIYLGESLIKMKAI